MNRDPQHYIQRTSKSYNKYQSRMGIKRKKQKNGILAGGNSIRHPAIFDIRYGFIIMAK